LGCNLMKTLLFAAAALAVLASAPAQAAAISGLFNTGTDAAGVALAGGAGVTDSHYLLAASDVAGYAGHQAVTFNCCYLADDANSRWISMDSGGGPTSHTVYRTTFGLTGAQAATARITGGFATDDHAEIFLNGVYTGFHADVFTALTSFDLTSGFLAGVNTLDFQVFNSGGPGGLRVDDFAGTSGAVGVPEPSVWALMLLGFGAAGVALRRRRAFALAA
jgi:hypothetical protein